MEPVSLTATAIATLIFSEALKEGGKTLGLNQPMSDFITHSYQSK
jgi:hypothetical protein